MKVQKTLEDVLQDQPATVGDVIEKLRELRADLEKNPEQWENASLSRYLEAMQVWLEAVRVRVGSEPSWRLFVMMLETAKFYE